MELKTAIGSLVEVEADCAVVGVYQGMMESPLPGAAGQVDEALDGQISALIEDGEIRGKLGEITIIHTLGRITPRRVMVVGGGPTDEANANLLRRLAAEVARRARANSYKQLTASRPAAHYLTTVEAAQASAEGALLGLYKISTNGASSDDSDNRDIESVTFVAEDASDLPDLDLGLDRGAIIAEAVALARDLANEPANRMTPTILAERAKDAADAAGVTFSNLSVGEITEMGMGGLLGVAAGSHEPPAFIILEHKGDPTTIDPPSPCSAKASRSIPAASQSSRPPT